MNDPGIYLKHYPSSQDIQASASVLTFRILVKVVANLAASLQSVNLSRNTGVDLEVLYHLVIVYVPIVLKGMQRTRTRTRT